LALAAADLEAPCAVGGLLVVGAKQIRRRSNSQAGRLRYVARASGYALAQSTPEAAAGGIELQDSCHASGRSFRIGAHP